jgi:hypothetical protein
MDDPYELGSPPGGGAPPPQAVTLPAQHRRAARRKRRITLASSGAIVGIAVGVVTIWHLLTEPKPPPPEPGIVKDLRLMTDQAAKLGKIRFRIGRSVMRVQARTVTLANGARNITEDNRQRREVLQTLRQLRQHGQKPVPNLAAQLSDIVVLEQKTAAAYVACFRSGHATCPPALALRDQQGDLKSIFASNFDVTIAKYQYPIDSLNSSDF